MWRPQDHQRSEFTRIKLVSVYAVTLFLLKPSMARANPVMVHPASLMAFGVVAFGSFVVEAGGVALLADPRGIARLRGCQKKLLVFRAVVTVSLKEA
ncbi:MAG TPA: hypothetical protein VNZ64_24965 [Candidatus Acidoferrum sp.]|jgi:hypothetical protein|nr:hypothetical protein [Candidatus Acidoferrum sp.]